LEEAVWRTQRGRRRIVFVETLLRRVVDLAEEYPRGEVPDHVLWEEPGDDYDEYIEAAKRLEGEGLVEKGTSDYATLRATEKGKKAIKGFRE
jgi:hypothetical protein